MKSTRLLSLMVLTVIAASLGGKVASAERKLSENQNDPPKFALLVGINKYRAGSGITELFGTENDVRLMKSLLVENGFTEELAAAQNPALAPCGLQKASSGIKTLCSKQATKDAIIKAFDEHLIANAKAYWKGAGATPSKGPMIMLYYSGHGSQVADTKPLPGEKEPLDIDEADGLDETLVPYDSDAKGTRDIRDDLIKGKLGELKKYTTNIIFMADSCHSGTISRGPGGRSIPREFPDLKIGVQNGRGEEVDMSSDDSYVTISGSLTSQKSFEDPLPNEKSGKDETNGYLTYNFVNSVRRNPGSSYSEIITLVRNAISAMRKPQTPQVEGDSNRIVFGDAGKAKKRAIAIKCPQAPCARPVSPSADRDVRGLYRVAIDAGRILGATSGGPVVVYASSATDFTKPEGRIATGEIAEGAKAFSSEAEIQFTDPTMNDLPPLAKVVLVSPYFSREKAIVAIDVKSKGTIDAGAASMKTLVGELKTSAFYQPFESTDILRSLDTSKRQNVPGSKPNWHLAVVRTNYGEFKKGVQKSDLSKNSTEPPDSTDVYYLADQAGDPIYKFWVAADATDVATSITTALEKHAKVVNIRGLRNETSPLNPQISIEQIRYKTRVETSPGSGTCEATTYNAAEINEKNEGPSRYSRAEAFDLRITNSSTKSLYLYLFSVDSAGEIKLIYPFQGAQEKLAAGKPYLISENNPCGYLGFQPDQNGNLAPTGFETVKVIVSENPIEAELLTSPAIRGNSKGEDNFLEMMLRQAGTQTRSGPISRNGIENWAAFNIDYTVVP